MSNITLEDKKAYIEEWCKRNKLELVEINSSFGKPLLCIGDYTFDVNNPILVAIMWYDDKFLDEDKETSADSLSDEDFEVCGRLDNNGVIPLPSLIYDKSYTMYIQLSNNSKEKAMDELFNLIVWFVDNKFKVKRRNVSKEEYDKLTSWKYHQECQDKGENREPPITYLSKN